MLKNRPPPAATFGVEKKGKPTAMLKKPPPAAMLKEPPSKETRLPAATMKKRASTQKKPLISLDTLKQILGFVCEKQYQFVAAVNRRFKDTYLEIFLP